MKDRKCLKCQYWSGTHYKNDNGEEEAFCFKKSKMTKSKDKCKAWKFDFR